MTTNGKGIAVVIPCFRAATSICDVVASIHPKVEFVICVDDGCPEASHEKIAIEFGNDPRVHIIQHETNKGVGAAVITGYRKALDLDAWIIVKMDADAQMDPQQIDRLITPIIEGRADYTKGNRFFSPENLSDMPLLRIIGNAGLSFITKVSSGYWGIMDPSNGFTAIHVSVAHSLPLDKISERYFFESDMLFRLGMLRAVITDIPMKAIYGENSSNLNEWYSLMTFPFLSGKNLIKRIIYDYFVRDFNIASINMVLGILLSAFGVIFGATSWYIAETRNIFASAGTVMLSGLPLIVGIQLLLNFLSYDMSNRPLVPVHPNLPPPPALGSGE